MKGEDIARIISSPAFTIFTATVCVLLLAKQFPEVVNTIKSMKKRD